MEWKSIDLSSKLSLTCGANVNVILFLLVGIGNILAILKTDQLLFAKLKGRGWPFLESVRRGTTLSRSPQRALGCHKKWKRFSFWLSHSPCFTWKFFMICFHKILQLIFQKHHVLEIYLLNTEENYLTWEPPCKFSYTLRTTIL